jgi:hypothetical protein
MKLTMCMMMKALTVMMMWMLEITRLRGCMYDSLKRKALFRSFYPVSNCFSLTRCYIAVWQNISDVRLRAASVIPWLRSICLSP